MIKDAAWEVGEIVVRSLIDTAIKLMFMGLIVIWVVALAIDSV